MILIRRLALPSLVVLLSLALAGPAAAYIILLKDGSRIVAKDKPVAQGKNYVFQTPLGARQSVPIDEVDQEKTEKANADGFGNAYVLGETPDGKPAPVAGKKPSLSEYIKQNKKSEVKAGQGTPMEQSAAAAGASGKASSKAPKMGEETPPALDTQVSDTFARALDASGVRGARLVPIPGGVRVQAITDGEQQVFAALGAVARGLKESRASGKSVEKVDLYLATSSGETGGRFLMSPVDAESILNGTISVPRYFVANVIF